MTYKEWEDRFVVDDESKRDYIVKAYTPGQEYQVFIIYSDLFVSEYQERIYVEDWDEIYDENWNIRDDRMWEFIAEPFREYIVNSKNLEKISQSFII